MQGSAARDDGDVVEAAGGVVVRDSGAGGLEVVIVHRPKYDDWSFPKGKLDAGESFTAAAVREVEEETGLRCRAGRELTEARYVAPSGEPKRVRYWVMRRVEGSIADRRPDAEIDEVRWATLAEARSSLTYEHDRAMLDELDDALASPRR